MDFGAFVDLLQNNRADMTAVFNRVGGIGGVFDMAPALIRIMSTLSKHKGDPQAAADHVERVLYYSQQTKDRIAAWQKAHGLTPDGLIGERTWNKIEEVTQKDLTS